jgi:hypothetical protein
MQKKMIYVAALEGFDEGGTLRSAYFQLESDMGPAETKAAIEASLAKNTKGTRLIGFIGMPEEAATPSPTDSDEWRKFQQVMGRMLCREN